MGGFICNYNYEKPIKRFKQEAAYGNQWNNQFCAKWSKDYRCIGQSIFLIAVEPRLYKML